jgi:hypothetical protein
MNAGAILVVLNNLLKRTKHEIAGSWEAWNATGPNINGHSLGEAIAAGAANFRHFEDWARDNPPTLQQLPSIRIVADVLGVQIGEAGADHPFGRNVCPELLRKISNGDFDVLSTAIF